MEFYTNTVGGMIFQNLLLTQEDMPDDFAVKMLTNNEIDGLLKLSVLRKNFDIEVRYNVTSLIPLAQFMESVLTKKKVLAVLKSIGSVACEIEEYMLSQNGLALNVNNIYVDIATGKAFLMYIPSLNYQGGEVLQFAKGLVTSFQYEQTEDTSYVLKLMNAFNNGAINSTKAYSDFISKMMDEKKEVKNEVKKDEPIMKPGGYEREKPLERVVEMKTPQNNVQVSPVIPPQSEIPKPLSDEKKMEKKKGLFAKPAVEKKEKPKQKLFGKKAEAEQATSSSDFGFAVPGMESSMGEFKVPDAPQKPAEKMLNNINNPVVQQTPDLPVAPSVPLDYGNTIMVNQNNSTSTIMLEEGAYEMQGVLAASITRTSNNQKMYVDKDILKMGKESDYVDFYIGNNPTISRSHADIIKKDGSYYIRDNNAKNHTYVNGEMITPGQLVELSNNDEIKLSNEVFVFHLS